MALAYYAISYFPGGSAGLKFISSSLTSSILRCFGRWHWQRNICSCSLIENTSLWCSSHSGLILYRYNLGFHYARALYRIAENMHTWNFGSLTMISSAHHFLVGHWKIKRKTSSCQNQNRQIWNFDRCD